MSFGFLNVHWLSLTDVWRTYFVHTGLTLEENSTHLSDVILMRIAQRLRTEHLYPLTAGLLSTVKYLDYVKANFADLDHADHAYLVMTEWRKQTKNQRTDRDTTAEKLVKILEEGNIDHHLVCLVYILVKSYNEYSVAFRQIFGCHIAYIYTL